MNKVIYSTFAILAIIAISQVQSAVLPISSKEVALVTSSPSSSSSETSIDTLGSSRVKRQGGGCGCCGCGCGCGCCGCGGGGGGCGCCCCRPRCCCRRCCTCCRTCCCTRCCTCCRPCCCGCGCGCCGCGGGGGRKRRSLQNLRIALANKIEGIAKVVKGSDVPALAPFNDAPTTVQEKKDVIN
ncbi:Protein CBG02315 [Caenorhabditis briggsae]|uniref:Uncharacterized protein n=2 Tax=Caenorhabditis briggsae TaxID=6238 RepID=A0AAE9IV63_CAEBR|nr:Protein CBG02315 [Caenorhabditis briggsae]ULU07096.1 hypothetical protein L3Y34_018701 [Caenorhabditis briggsae]CAP24180.1 Protein CBG02315 [Caenorhabditis briggsae]